MDLAWNFDNITLMTQSWKIYKKQFYMAIHTDMEAYLDGFLLL